MATQGTAPRDPEPPPAPARGWADARVVPLRPHPDGDDRMSDEADGDKRAPSRGIGLGLLLSAILWSVALYVAFRLFR